MLTLMSQFLSSFPTFPGRSPAPAKAPSRAAVSATPDGFRQFVTYAECKRLLGRWRQQQLEHGLRSLALLSLNSGEGKTFCAATLAIGHSETWQERVLVIDCTSAPRESEEMPELTRLCLGEALGVAAVAPVELPRPTAFARIDLLSFTGLDDEPLSEYAMGDILNLYGAHYPMIIVDTCAIGSRNRHNPDPVLLAGQCDRAALVVSDRLTPATVADDLLPNLRGTNVRTLGIITNEGIHGK